MTESVHQNYGVHLIMAETYGEMRERSTEEPLPGPLLGLVSVSSTSVQPSPLKPQDPVWRYLKSGLAKKNIQTLNHALLTR